MQLKIIPPRSGVSFILKKDQRLKVVDVEGGQVSDFICYNLYDKAEYLSSGRTIDYAETIYLTKATCFIQTAAILCLRWLRILLVSTIF
jgi:uncharacterized protein YcgI (DUF1989 family)